MASSVFYRFRSQKDESRVTFDGTGISVFDLKKEIILANNLTKANDFDLVVLDSSMEGSYSFLPAQSYGWMEVVDLVASSVAMALAS